MKNLFKPRQKARKEAKGERYPQYYRHKTHDIVVRVKGPRQYDQVLFRDGRLVLTPTDVKLTTCKAIFKEDPTWEAVESDQWGRMYEKASAQGAGTGPPMDYVTEIAGRKVFQFRQIEDMPAGRMQEAQIIIQELAATLDAKELREALTKALQCMEPGADGNIPLMQAHAIISNILNRMQLTYNFNLYEKLCAFWFIEDGEDATQYNPHLINQKLTRWKKAGGMDFFLSLPLKEFLPSGIASLQGLQDFLKKAEIKRRILQDRLKDLIK